MTFWFGLFLIIFGLISIGVVIYLWPRKETSKQTPEEKPHSLQDQAQPGQGVIENVITRVKVGSDAKTQAVVNEATGIATEGIRLTTDAISADFEKKAIPERHRQTTEAEDARHQTELTRLETERVKSLNEQLEDKYRIAITEIAFNHSMDVPTYLQVTGHRELKQIDLQARATEYNQDQDNLSRVQQEKLELIDRATKRLFGFYEDRKELEASDEPAKDDKLNHLNQLISGAERLILGEQDRFIQSTLGQEAPRSLSAHDGGTGDSSEAEADQI
jgi:hypothetical protein